MDTRGNGRNWKRLAGLGVAVALGGLLLGASTRAQAKDEFEDGFKDELGRIAAHEAVGVGRHVLAEVLLGGQYRRPVYHYGRTTYHYDYPAPVYVVYPPHHRHKRHKHHRHHHYYYDYPVVEQHVHYHYSGCGHGYDDDDYDD